MIQDLRENLKGTVAVVVGAVVLVAMVMTGEQVSKTSLSDTVASVNGDDISAKDLSRAMTQEKIRLKNQFGLPDDAEQLKDENLKQPALASLMRQRAIIQAAQRAGMGVSEVVIKDQIKQAFTQDQQFNAQGFNSYLANFGYTQATLLQRESESFLVRQLYSGLSDSSFITQKDVELLAGIVGQKRTFSAITIPKEKATKVVPSEEEIAQYYQDNQNSFNEAEKVSLQYLEVSVEKLAKLQTVSDQEVKDAFDKELAEFKSEPELSIAHILISPSANTAESDAKIAQVQAKIKAGESFDSLAKSFSDDLGSKELGGDLGVMTGDAFPEQFKTAVAALKEGEVSEPLKSTAGTHFVKLVKKTQPVPPAFEARKAAIAQQLANDKASEKFTDQIKALEEATFGKSDLTMAATALSLKVQETELFSKSGAPGLASEPLVLEAAFAKDVLEQGQISKVLELPQERAVVVRLKEHQPSRVKPLTEVRTLVVDTLTQQKTAAQLQALAKILTDKLQAGVKPEAAAKELGYTFAQFDKQDRFKSTADREILQFAFGMVRPAAQPQIESFATRTGGQVVISLIEAANGTVSDLDPQQLAGIKSQVMQQKSSEDLAAFESSHYSAAKVKM
ncbi:MAG TPA: SurA N-terminal domain-containing protein [Cellvibrionaceae bacterium]